MEDKYSVGRKHSGIWKSLRDGDFEEEEVWDVLKNVSDYSSGVHKFKDKDHSSLLPNPSKPLSTTARMIPRASNSSASSSNEAKGLQQSAPVNIPDWSKIYRKNKNKAPKGNASRFHDYDMNHVSVVDGEDDSDGVNYGKDSDEYEEENDEYDSKLPPHEIIAKRLARSQISSFSVLEGAGRTLKGRDLSKVRNAVLTKTGFLESL
ncbi:uncharacterized protein LOC113848045 [Abrus precatorius]|uniref:Uncharacterized protein LOC113848045 n=1 Tax=Abrus precatorius TaxID=3816 RepID=A0A8B8JRN2_ABRPR|nr:uncharacterized protein LOC113848045 [Abrus precatorius]